MADDKTKRRPSPERSSTPRRAELALLELQGPSPGAVHRLVEGATILGRGDEADLVVADDGVSRKHVKLIRSAGGLLNVVDLGSTNGVFVNGERVELAVLQLGDVLELGPDVRLRLVDARIPVVDAQRSPAPDALGLTDRQIDIARLVAAGLTNTAIAERLNISPRTVTSHLDHIYTRLGIGSRAALVTRLAEAGLLRDPGSEP
jgi:DNA-binding CsgD family transcriptional regulator